MKLTGPACTEAMNGAEERNEEKERKTMQAGSELSGGLGRWRRSWFHAAIDAADY